MKKRILTYMIALLVVTGFYSCSKDYLEEVNPNNLTTDLFWRDLKDAEAGLNATYNSMLNHYLLNLDVAGLKSDMGWPGYGRPSGTSSVSHWYFLTYSSTDSKIFDKWNACYRVIFRANQVLDGLEKIKGDMETESDILAWTYIKGQAHYMRGLMHSYLYHSFNNGSVIIRDFVPSTLEEYSLPVSTAEDVYEFFMKDLRYAYEVLPEKYLQENSNTVQSMDIGRFGKGAVAAALGLNHLYEANYDSAYVYFNDLLTNTEYGYSLVSGDNVHDMFSLAGEFNSEAIVELNYNLTYETHLGGWAEESFSNRWAKMTVSNEGPLLPAWAVWAFKTEPMDTLDSRNYYENDTMPNGRALRNVPLRCSRMVTVVEDEQTLFHQTNNVFAGATFQSYGFGFGRCSKYADYHDTPLESTWYSGKNVVITRLAEIYLRMAECQLKKASPNVQEALNLVNTVRRRWGLELLGDGSADPSHQYDGYNYEANPDSLMERLMYIEVPLELWLEGHNSRWIDLRRWGVTKERYESLSNQTYYAIDYTGHNLNGGEETKGAVSVQVEVDQEYIDQWPENQLPNHYHVIDYEYDYTAVNYSSEIHDYYPIPQGEASANSAIN